MIAIFFDLIPSLLNIFLMYFFRFINNTFLPPTFLFQKCHIGELEITHNVCSMCEVFRFTLLYNFATAHSISKPENLGERALRPIVQNRAKPVSRINCCCRAYDESQPLTDRQDKPRYIYVWFPLSSVYQLPPLILEF